MTNDFEVGEWYVIPEKKRNPDWIGIDVPTSVPRGQSYNYFTLPPNSIFQVTGEREVGNLNSGFYPIIFVNQKNLISEMKRGYMQERFIRDVEKIDEPNLTDRL